LTTVSAALYLGGKLTVIGVGDSPAFLVRSNALQQLSSARRGVFLGAAPQLQGLSYMEVSLEPGDRLVLATDGITDNIPSSQLAEVIRHSGSPDEATSQLKTIMDTQSAGVRSAAAPLQGRFRSDDWSAIVRFFSATCQKDCPENPMGADIKTW
jgi:serine/threonine protein phosphatase PrpC